MIRERRLARALPWTLGAGTLLLLFAGRQVLEGRASIRRADELASQGEVCGSIAHAMRAARAYVPFAPHVREGYDRLRATALRAELDGDLETALLAWEAVRAASKGTRTLWTPFVDRLSEADDHVSSILAAQPPSGIDRDRSRELLAQDHRALLAREGAARPWAIVVFYAALSAWVVGAWRAFSAFDRTAGTRRGGLAISGSALALIGLAAMLFALARA
jgi:hypothetical protein